MMSPDALGSPIARASLLRETATGRVRLAACCFGTMEKANRLYISISKHWPAILLAVGHVCLTDQGAVPLGQVQGSTRAGFGRSSPGGRGSALRMLREASITKQALSSFTVRWWRFTH